MLDRVARHLYERLGRRYTLVFLVVQVPTAVFVALVTVALIATYYDPSTGEWFALMGSGAAFTFIAVAFALLRGRRFLDDVATWTMADPPTREQTITAWDAATNFPVRSFRRNSLTVNALACVPSVAATLLILDLPWWAGFVVLGATIIAAVYTTVLNYAMAELLMRPVVSDISSMLPEAFGFTANGLLLRKRLVIALPAFTSMTGFVVATLAGPGSGTGTLALVVLFSIGVGVALSFELSVLLSRSVTIPIARLRTALARVRTGDYGARVPVVTSDELGELTVDFNLMASGLAEREALRDAFGTYLDKDVARFILSGRFPEDGVEIDVSIMFCDVRGFTPYAESAAAGDVIAALNALFETVVPIVERHGGHVDKFLGDGLLAVFGAPEGFADHADRAVAAGLEIAAAVNRGPGELQVGVGVNSGRVVAGSIGGAGRLNFSVIGDAVNVAARVEAATRDTGHDMLITAATREALTRAPGELDPRGTIPLKGKAEPVEVLAPVPAGAPVSRSASRR
jgi:class 3 adenylate cyclase